MRKFVSNQPANFSREDARDLCGRPGQSLLARGTRRPQRTRGRCCVSDQAGVARHALSKDVIAGVSERSGGVRLFVEEVTRLLLERGEAGGVQAINGSKNRLTWPQCPAMWRPIVVRSAPAPSVR